MMGYWFIPETRRIVFVVSGRKALLVFSTFFISEIQLDFIFLLLIFFSRTLTGRISLIFYFFYQASYQRTSNYFQVSEIYIANVPLNNHSIQILINVGFLCMFENLLKEQLNIIRFAFQLNWLGQSSAWSTYIALFYNNLGLG